MSIPRRDPHFTMEQLREVGDRFLKVGYEYWEALHKAGIGGACAWVEDNEKGLVIFTRGEYRDTLLRNIPELGPVHQFGSAGENDQPETQ